MKSMRSVLPIWVVLLVLAAGVIPAQQPRGPGYQDQAGWPDGVKGQRIRALLDLVNAPAPGDMEAFLRDHCTAAMRQAFPVAVATAEVAGWRRTAGKLEFHGLRTYDPPRPGTTVIVKAANLEDWRAFTIEFAPSPEALIANLRFSPARPPTDVKPDSSPLTEAQFLKKVDDFACRAQACHLFSGSLLVAKDDQVLLSYAGGESNRGDHVLNKIDTKFNLGSMNKMFTAVAIAQLAERGKLSYQDTLDKYVDENWLPKDITAKITIENLLSHRSGLGSYFNKTFMEASRAAFRELADYRPLLKEEKLQFQPGSRFGYSNTGFFLLGVVVEKASGQNYFDYIRKNIYEPAGMKDSDCYDLDLPIENLAIGYIPDESTPYGWRSNTFQHVIRGGPAGGGYATGPDLLRFARALQTGKLVSADSLKTLWTDHFGDQYGYGFIIAAGAAGRQVGHSGGFPGLSANLAMYLDKGYVVCVLSNTDMGAEPLVQRIGEWLARLAP